MRRYFSLHATLAVIAAALFGASAPIAKLLLGKVEPIPLAALVYLGSGIMLLLFRWLRRITSQSVASEAPLTTRDTPWLIGAILAGGVAAPIALMIGLEKTPASTASLLLNFEGVSTALIAVMLFREAVGRRIWWAIGCITAASIVLSLETSGKWGISAGAFGVISACILWGFDNNFTRSISAKDPLAIVTVKGLIAGSFSLILAAATGSRMPGLPVCALALVFGSISYGLSIVLFILAMRGLGAARTGALFGTAPFVGATISFLVFRNTPDVSFVVSVPLMLIGAGLLLSEDHAHEHAHLPLEHDHKHCHDEHHEHSHEYEESAGNVPHAHVHRHTPMTHVHPHTPDDHHRHEHQPET